MKKVAFICNSTNPDLVNYFDKKISGLKNDAFFLANFSLAKERNLTVSSFSKKNGFSVFFILDFIYAFFLVFRLLIKRVSVVIFDTAHISNIPIAFLLKIFRVELIFTIHDWSPHEGAQSRNVKIYNFLVRELIADQLIVFSPVSSKNPVRNFTLSGYDWRGQNCSESISPKFLFFGRIEPYKGLSNLVEIAKYLKNNRPDAIITVAGKGNDSALEELHSLSNVDVRNFFIDEAGLDKLISESSCVLLPYKSATQSGVVIHSYSYGKPVVSFNVGALADYIEDGQTGILCEPGDIIGFAKSAIFLHENQKLFNGKVEEVFKSKYDSCSLVRQYKKLIMEFDKR